MFAGDRYVPSRYLLVCVEALIADDADGDDADGDAIPWM
jgi:hypothetical protein